MTKTTTRLSLQDSAFFQKTNKEKGSLIRVEK